MTTLVNKPKLSVIVPVYKVEKYIRKCINSILSQDFTDFELLLIDDGTPDQSGIICDDYAREDKRVKVIHKKNGGVSSARNLGLEHVQGQWVMFVDADDWIGQNMMSSMMNHSENSQIDVMVLGYEREVPEGVFDSTESSGLREGVFEVASKDYIYSMKPQVWNFIFRSSIIHKFDVRFNEDIHFGEDVLFVYDYFRRCTRVYVNPACFYKYNCFNQSSTSFINLEKSEEHLIVGDIISKSKEENICLSSFWISLMFIRYVDCIASNYTLSFWSKRRELLHYFKKYKSCRKDLKEIPLSFQIKIHFPVLYLIYLIRKFYK